MIVGDETIDVRDGDAVYGPPGIPHGLTNDSDDWVEQPHHQRGRRLR